MICQCKSQLKKNLSIDKIHDATKINPPKPGLYLCFNRWGSITLGYFNGEFWELPHGDIGDAKWNEHWVKIEDIK